jgi:predicted glutamine amidotransferase
MCKFFFSYNLKKSKKLLQEFLLHGNAEHLEYGYGIGWQRDQRQGQRNGQGSNWETYKCNCFHMTDPKSQKILEEIDSNVIVSHIRNIYHENMTPKQIADELNPHNVHPFTYGGAIFMHHGDLFMDYNNELNAYQLNREASKFKHAISSVMKIILPKFKKLMWKTDSELMFYLLLSIQHSLINSNKSTYQSALVQSFYILHLCTFKTPILHEIL